MFASVRDMSPSLGKCAIVGAGATTLYVLQNLLRRGAAGQLRSLTVFERGRSVGMGMPYNPETTDHENLCNISSEEIPHHGESFVQWLRTQDDATLASFGLGRRQLSASETYGRVILGRYFEDAFHAAVEQLRAEGLDVDVRTNTQVTDLVDDPRANVVEVHTLPVHMGPEGDRSSNVERFDRVVIATGHNFGEADSPTDGYFASAWPIHKLLPPPGSFHRFPVATIGASLSAFDVVASLAHRHGRFESRGDGPGFRYVPDPEAGNFRLVLHTLDGRLPHLQYGQREPMRALYRHFGPADWAALRDGHGQVRLKDYWDVLCRPALAAALRGDGRAELAARMEDPSYSMAHFVEQMGQEHTYDDAFAGMRSELPEARRSLEQGKPIRWKEVLDDLMYALNFHAEQMPAEDHRALQRVMMPFLMNVIAALPLTSARKLLALHEANRIDLVTGRAKVVKTERGQTTLQVGEDDDAPRATYQMVVDCTGQGAVSVDDFPFRTLVEHGTVRTARVAGSDGQDHDLPGIDVDRGYRVRGTDGEPNPRVYDIAFSHTLGLRPYSYGLQACNETAGLLVEAWQREASRRSELVPVPA